MVLVLWVAAKLMLSGCCQDLLSHRAQYVELQEIEGDSDDATEDAGTGSTIENAQVCAVVVTD